MAVPIDSPPVAGEVRPAATPRGGTLRPAVPPPASGIPPRRQWGWRSADVLRAAALVIGLYLALRLFWLTHPLLLTAFLGILFGLAVARAADYGERWRIPRGVSATVVVLGFYGLLVAIGIWAAPTLREQFGELRARLPQAIQQVDRWIEEHRGGMVGQILASSPMAAPPADAGAGGAPAARPGPTAAAPIAGRSGAPAAGRPGGERGGIAQRPRVGAGRADEAPEEGSFDERAAQLRSGLADQLGAVGRYLFSFLSSTIAVFTGLLLITFVSIYIGSDPNTYREGLLHLVPHPSRPRAREVLDAVATALRKWLLSQFIAMLVIGTVTTIALMLLGVEAALSLGIIAGLLEFIPTVGPLLSAVPAIAMGFLDSPQKALMVAIAYMLIQFLENHILIPLLMKQGVDLPPVLTILGQALMAIVFGFLGLLVAVPVMAAILVAVKMLYVEDVVGDDVAIPEAASG